MPALLDFVDSMASCWDRIGIKLGLEDKVAELRRREAFPSSHLIMLLEIWLQSGRGVSWARLVDVLENPAVNMGTVAANIKDYLIKQGLYCNTITIIVTVLCTSLKASELMCIQLYIYARVCSDLKDVCFLTFASFSQEFLYVCTCVCI